MATRGVGTAIRCAIDICIGGDRRKSDTMRGLLDVEPHQEEKNLLNDESGDPFVLMR